MTGLRVMVVEDEFIVALELRDVLEAMGHQVCRVVGSGKQAVGAAAFDRPDCVLMDVNIQGPMGGVEAAAEIQMRFPTQVILLTGLPVRALEEQVRELRHAAVLSKPVDHDQLRAVLDGLPSGGNRTAMGFDSSTHGHGHAEGP
jgi:CheY-like chemotaxis protein